MSHVVSSDTGMPVQRLMKIVESGKGLMVQGLWQGLPEPGDTLEPLSKIDEYVPQLLLKLLVCMNTPTEVAAEARRKLHL